MQAAPDAPSTHDVAHVFQDCGAPIAEQQAIPLAAYLTLLLKWNRRMNLVGTAAWRTVVTDLFLDSWHLAAFVARLPLPPAPITLDLGAGAGIPGIPLRIFWTAGTYVLVEIRQKRTAFLHAALGNLGLPRTEVFAGRAEDALERYRPDLILSRAFRPWAEVLELTHGKLAAGGMAIIMASTPLPEQLPSGWSAVASMSYASGPGERWLWALAETRP